MVGLRNREFIFPFSAKMVPTNQFIILMNWSTLQLIAVSLLQSIGQKGAWAGKPPAAFARSG